MADTGFADQLATVAGADEASTAISQNAPVVGGDDAATSVSQTAPIAGGDDARTFISQAGEIAGTDDARTFIDQYVLLVGTGPEVIPPTETPVDTFTFDEGLGNEWFLALQLSDSGDELRDKVVKSFRFIGKVTRAMAKVYRYGPFDDIRVDHIERGIGQVVVLSVPDTDHVQQTKRFPINVPHAMLHTIRLEGRWNGDGERDRVDEIVMEVSRSGARR